MILPKSRLAPHESAPVVPGSISIPSITTNGCVFGSSLEFPRMRIFALDEGPPAPCAIYTPATLPCKASTKFGLFIPTDVENPCSPKNFIVLAA